MNARMSFLKHAATLGPVGYIPIASGTFGTLVAVIFLLVLRPSPAVHLGLAVFFTVFGTYASHEAEKLFNKKDPGYIVIDEFAGYLVATLYLPMTAGYYLASFILFRVFDILKPPPARQLQNIRGGPGVMLDDIAAGVMANLVLVAWRFTAQSL